MILIAPFWQVYVSAKNCLWISLVWMQPGKISVWMMSQCNKKKFVVCDGSDNFLRWLFLDLRWSCMTVGPLTIWSNYRPKMTDYPSFLHSSSTRLEFTPQKNVAKFYTQKIDIINHCKNLTWFTTWIFTLTPIFRIKIIFHGCIQTSEIHKQFLPSHKLVKLEQSKS